MVFSRLQEGSHPAPVLKRERGRRGSGCARPGTVFREALCYLSFNLLTILQQATSFKVPHPTHRKLPRSTHAANSEVPSSVSQTESLANLSFAVEIDRFKKPAATRSPIIHTCGRGGREFCPDFLLFPVEFLRLITSVRRRTGGGATPQKGDPEPILQNVD